jgi:dienelactone hydrolase
MRLRKLIHSRLLALACLLFLAWALAACGDGGGGPEPPAPADPCGPAGVPDGGACRTFALRLEDRIPTPFIEAGLPVELQVVLYRPLRTGPHPALLFHHGSTGDGSDPSLFAQTWVHRSLAAWFADRGWMVVFAQRRGRGQSGGRYDEGFRPDRSGYSCEAAVALAGAARALEDVNLAADWLLLRPDVDPARLLVGGQSRGGILAVAQLPQRPGRFRGAINFVGGWLGEGCGDFAAVNRTLFEDGAAGMAPALWLYARNDSFYGIGHSRGNFDAFVAAGGTGEFHEYSRAAGLEGHYLINDPPLWGAAVSAFMAAF